MAKFNKDYFSIEPSRKYKALFFLVVFSLNTVVGFACSAGLDMGFNTKHHHHHEEDVKISSGETEIVDHHDDEQHHHKLTKEHKDADDNCCNKGVAEFSQFDKLLAHLFTVENQTQVFFIRPVLYYLSDLAITAKIPSLIQVSRSRFSAFPDIRVSIRSFQI